MSSLGGLKQADGGGVGQAVGRGGGEWSGCGGVSVEDLLGLIVGKFELGAVIFEKIPVSFHG